MSKPRVAADGDATPWHQREPDALTSALREVVTLGALIRPAVARQLELSLTEVWALEHLVAEPLGPVELSRRLEITSAASTVLVRRLEAAGHVSRRPHEADGRRTVLTPTPTALHRMFEVLNPMLDGLEAAGQELTGHDREIVTAYLTRVAEALRIQPG